MYLKSLEVQGFKSFPDKTLIRFGDDITAIVGPNGSGKSNISDAIVWVMGEQSSKTLRGAKMEDVIFGGTAKRPAVGFAEATLTLDNSDRALPYDADEVMVTRRYYRSGDSEYYINRQSSRLRDIHEMFMDTGLGREGYSNIGQGRIDEVLSLKSADRREIFEEAAGISRYRHRKEETERKLAATEDNLLRIGDKVSELEIQLDPLREQSEKAKKYLDLKQELRGVEIAVWLDTLEKLSAAARKAEEDYASASFVLQQANDELDALYKKSEQLSQDLRQQDGELENQRIRLSMLQGNRQQLSGQEAVLRSGMDNNAQNIERIRQEMEGQDSRSGGISGQIQQAREQIIQTEERLARCASQIGSLQQELAAMAASAQGLTQQYIQGKSRETELTASIAAAQADLRSLQEGKTQLESQLEQILQDLTAGESRRAAAGEALRDCRISLAEAQDRVRANNNTIAGFLLRQRTRQERRDQLDTQLRQLTAQLDGVSAKAGAFRAMERDFDSYQRSVRQVMQEAQRGGLKNIHGPVSRLIRTEDELTVAIEIALGGAMQQIVVDSEADGKAAIGYLKRTGGGRATFLPISTIRGKTLQENGLERSAGFVGIASELVQTQEVYRQIVENLLGRTVICENIDCAIAMARKFGNRFKIVTLDGQVMNAGGSMTGGSVSKEAGILSRANELEKLTKQEQKLQEKKKLAQQELQEAQRSLDQVEFELKDARDRLRSAQDEVLTLQGQEQQHLVLLQALEDAAAARQRERENLLHRRMTDAQRGAGLEERLRLQTGQLDQLRLELEQLEGSRSESTKQSDALTQRINDLRQESAALEAQKQTVSDHILELEQLRSAMEGDRQQKIALIASLEQENSQLEKQLQELLDRQSREDEALQQAQQELSLQLKRRADAEAAKTKAERQAQEKSKDILNMDRACTLLENKRSTTALEERTILDKLWDSYGLTPASAEPERTQIESVAGANRRIGELKRKIGGLGTPNLGAIEEYARVNERYTYLVSQRDDVLTSKRELESIIRGITQEMTTIFVTEFEKINHYFGKTFEEMFGGGKGQLILEDRDNPLTCGIEIRVQPPGKQLKTITLLSGGEKAFVATALYFAILKVRPTPFCILDEIDAALDDRNVERYASYLRTLSKRTQFIVITHRRGTMEASDVLYGVTMQEQGVSKLLRLDLNQMEEYLGIME